MPSTVEPFLNGHRRNRDVCPYCEGSHMEVSLRINKNSDLCAIERFPYYRGRVHTNFDLFGTKCTVGNGEVSVLHLLLVITRKYTFNNAGIGFVTKSTFIFILCKFIKRFHFCNRYTTSSSVMTIRGYCNLATSVRPTD